MTEFPPLTFHCIRHLSCNHVVMVACYKKNSLNCVIFINTRWQDCRVWRCVCHRLPHHFTCHSRSTHLITSSSLPVYTPAPHAPRCQIALVSFFAENSEYSWILCNLPDCSPGFFWGPFLYWIGDIVLDFVLLLDSFPFCMCVRKV